MICENMIKYGQNCNVALTFFVSGMPIISLFMEVKTKKDFILPFYTVYVECLAGRSFRTTDSIV